MEIRNPDPAQKIPTGTAPVSLEQARAEIARLNRRIAHLIHAFQVLQQEIIENQVPQRRPRTNWSNIPS